MRTRSKTIFDHFFFFVLLVSLLDGAMTYTPASAAGILFVKPVSSGNGNCASWANACTLQLAIDRSFAGDQIWAKAGTYIPDASDRTISFILKSGVEIYGGFFGTEIHLNQRDPTVNITILSGDLNGDDSGITNNEENSFHVVQASNTSINTILDGFTITGGNADAGFISGGGIYLYRGSLTLTNVNFSGNFAIDKGSGMYNDGGSATLTNVTFSENHTIYDGGGGAMFNNGGSPTLTDVIFFSNSGSSGGAMFNLNSVAMLTNVTFLNNFAFNTGGGMFSNGGSPTLTNVTFSGNSANYGGGGMSSYGGSPTLTNVTFSGNSTPSSGGGISSNNSNLRLTNVTFSGNSASEGGGMSSYGGSVRLNNTIIADSPSGGDCVNESVTLATSSSNNLFEDASSACGLMNGVNSNIVGFDPKLGPLAHNGGFTRTHALLAGSPAINTGTNANCPATDQRGLTRPQGTHCDIGSFEARILTISGNAGTASVTLNYNIDSAPKAVTSQPNGMYAVAIPEGWSGTVTPSHPCFTFSPVNRSYSSVLTNQTAQNYSATFNPAAGCANINVKIRGTSVGTYGIPSQGSLRVSYAGINNGPMNATSTNGKPIIAAERVLSKNGTQITHFSELMGLPQNLVSTTYAFPAYDNYYFDSQLRFGNVSTSTATVHLYIGTREMTSGCSPSNSPYTLAPSASLRVSCPRVSGGPVKIVSDKNIVASLRVLYNNGSAVTSFSELMGLPASQWNTTYWMPWYNNVDLNTQLRIGNVGNTTTQVTVMVGGVIQRTFNLEPNAHSRFQIPGLNNGPVKITSSGGVPIVASQRVAHFNGTKWNDFSELMGLPASQLTTSYFFPWYNNKELDTQLRFGNISTSTAHVRVFIGGVEMPGSPFTLSPGASTRQSFAGINSGPVKLVSDVNIVASLRVICNNGGWSAFSELMGLPANQLTTSYVLPWYNNKDLDTQLRIGVP